MLLINMLKGDDTPSGKGASCLTWGLAQIKNVQNPQQTHTHFLKFNEIVKLRRFMLRKERPLHLSELPSPRFLGLTVVFVIGDAMKLLNKEWYDFRYFLNLFNTKPFMLLLFGHALVSLLDGVETGRIKAISTILCTVDTAWRS